MIRLLRGVRVAWIRGWCALVGVMSLTDRWLGNAAARKFGPLVLRTRPPSDEAWARMLARLSLDLDDEVSALRRTVRLAQARHAREMAARRQRASA